MTEETWEQKKVKGWSILAGETMRHLTYGKEVASLPFTQNELALALEKANAELMWKEVPQNGGQSNSKKFRVH